MFNRIWKKFTFALFAVTLLPIVYFGYGDLLNARESVIDSQLKNLFFNSVTRGKDIERTFFNAHSDISYLRSSLAIRTFVDVPSTAHELAKHWKAELEKEFSLFLLIKGGYSNIGFINEYGDEVVVVMKSGSEIFALDESQKINRLTSSTFVEAAKLDNFGIAGIPMRNRVDPGVNLRDVTLIRYSTKVFDSGGEPKGVLYLDLNGTEIFESLTTITFEKRRQAGLVMNTGNYIFNPYFIPEPNALPKWKTSTLKDEVPKEVSAQILSGKPGLISDDPKDLYGFYPVFPEPENDDFFFVAFDRYSKEFFRTDLNEIKKKYFIAGLWALLLCMAVALAVSFALTRNIGLLKAGVENIRSHNLDYRLNINSSDEIESLSKAYNLMADALKEYNESLEKKVEERTLKIKEVEKKLMQSEKLAAVGLLAAGVAHEINNPVSTILTRLELIKKDFENEKTEHLQKDLDVLYNHALRIGQITGNLLAFSREKPSGKKERVDLNGAVKRVLALVDTPIKKKGIEIKTVLSEDVPDIVANDAGIEQVIYNVVYNAYQATESGGRITIETGLEGNGKVELKISDTGMGIPEGKIDNIFEPFFTTKEIGKGTGLGLSISYGLIQDFGGAISVKSSTSTGTEFKITLDAGMEKPAGKA